MSKPVIAYMAGGKPERFHYRYSHWNMVPWIVILTGAIGATYWFFGWLAIPLGACAAAGLAIYLGWVNSRGNWECLIEGNSLRFYRPGDPGWTTIPMDHVGQFISVRFPNEERWDEIELVLRDSSRVALDHRLTGPSGDFKEVIRRSFPAIKFAKRDGTKCHACDADLRVRRDRCPECGAPIPNAGKG